MRRLIFPVLITIFLAAPVAVGKPGGASSVTIAASRNPIVFGSSTLITGQVTGHKAAGSSVQLQAEPFPFKAFATTATTTADATGHYSFKVAPGLNTIYRVIAHAAPAAMSANLLEKVRVKVTLRVSTSTPSVGQRVRFSGFVLPAYSGKAVLIQRRTKSGWRTMARATLVAASPVGTVARSKYSKRLKFTKAGSYRVWFNPADNARLANSSPGRKLS